MLEQLLEIPFGEGFDFERKALVNGFRRQDRGKPFAIKYPHCLVLAAPRGLRACYKCSRLSLMAGENGEVAPTPQRVGERGRNSVPAIDPTHGFGRPLAVL